MPTAPSPRSASSRTRSLAGGSEPLDVVAAGMNPIDVRIATGTFALERYEPPYVAGKEGVGRREDGSLVYFELSRDAVRRVRASAR